LIFFIIVELWFLFWSMFIA